MDETAALLLCVVCSIGAFLMWQVPMLARSLIAGGSFNAGGVGRAMSAPASKAVSGLNNMRADRIKAEARADQNKKDDQK